MSAASTEDVVPITVEFSGGLEMLFSNERKHKLSIAAKDESGLNSNVAFLVRYLCDNLMKDPRKDLFVLDGTVCVVPEHVLSPALTIQRRPGILVLINDADWELEGEDKYEIQKGDNILFVSTLHGG
ncbi:ubiquitin related modifier 1 [Mytilinidion resinicola]|uniref:Ubiquitin-related modifier 1 n=1 Tax=Mytilinidion resinicola TaxID=574789 RepID=A0A6A6Z837_9PEZI|nr:ubiquitin related modifier 1 [Mytilinidion resinicola]KAF2817206.1 ubiquitin related modifier 1 [Mytilinidion resinicola]